MLLCVVVPIKKLPGATGEFFYWVHELRLPVERKRNPLGPHNREFKDNGCPAPLCRYSPDGATVIGDDGFDNG